MNATDAKRIVDPNGTFAKDDPTRLRAEGYLAALGGVEVKALITTIKTLREVFNPASPTVEMINETLAEFRKAAQ